MDTTQFIKSTNGTIITVGKPYTFKSGIYGNTAIHVTAILGDVIHFSIDGGASSRQVRDFPELEDGEYFAISERIVRRSSVKNTIREVPGIVTTESTFTADQLSTMSAMEVGRYARKHYSTIGRLTKKADIIAAIRKMESTEETF